MPNHIVNIMTAPEHVLDSIRNEEGFVDFNKIIPRPAEISVMPATSDIETVVECVFGLPPQGMGDEAPGAAFKNLCLSLRIRPIVECKPMVNLEDPDSIDRLCQALRNQQKYGHFSWYTWSIEEWGTKWNAYGQEEERNTETQACFRTAWNPPFKVFEALSAKFPDEDLVVETADEDAGVQCYKLRYHGGEETARETLEGREAMLHYFRLHHNEENPSKEFLAEWGYDENFNYIEEGE